MKMLYNNHSLLKEMYNLRTKLDFYYDHALQFTTEKNIEALIEHGILARDGEILELEETYRHFFEEVMRSSEDINNATVEENIKRLQKYISYYQKEQNNTDGQRRYLHRIKSSLKTIDALIRNNINALHLNIDDAYKTAGSYDVKRERLQDYQESIEDIKRLISDTRTVLETEDATFRTLIPDERLLNIIADLQSDLRTAFNNIIELEQTIRDYLHKIDVQSKTLKRIRLLKQYADQQTMEADTNIREFLDGRNDLWMEPQRRNHIRPDIEFLKNTDDGADILELARKQIKTRGTSRRATAPPLTAEQMAIVPHVEDYVDTDKLAQAFMASGMDLFNFVISYSYDKKRSIDQRLEYYAEIVQGHYNSLKFTGEWQRMDNISYPIIYPR